MISSIKDPVVLTVQEQRVCAEGIRRYELALTAVYASAVMLGMLWFTEARPGASTCGDRINTWFDQRAGVLEEVWADRDAVEKHGVDACWLDRYFAIARSTEIGMLEATS